MSTPVLPLGNTWRYEAKLTKPDGTLDAGRADVQISLSDTEGGAAIASALTYAATETGAGTGVYRADIPGTDLATYVGTSRVGRAVYVRVTGAGLSASERVTVTPAQDASA